MVGQLLKRLWKAVAISFGIACLLFLLYELYSALVYETVYVGRRFGGYVDGAQGWVTRDTHPDAYWFMVAIDGFILLILGSLTAGAIYFGRNETRRIRKFTMRPPLERVIRQADTER